MVHVPAGAVVSVKIFPSAQIKHASESDAVEHVAHEGSQSVRESSHYL